MSKLPCLKGHAQTQASVCRKVSISLCDVRTGPPAFYRPVDKGGGGIPDILPAASPVHAAACGSQHTILCLPASSHVQVAGSRQHAYNNTTAGTLSIILCVGGLTYVRCRHSGTNMAW